MKRFKSSLIATCAIVIGLAAVLPSLPAMAEGSASLSIVPKKNYVIEPGKSVDDKLVIHNLDRSQPLNLNLRVVDFTYTDDGGAPKLFLDPSAPQTTWSLKPYIKLPKNVTVDPNSTATIPMSVAIPAGHGAGSYYSAIVYSSGASDGGNVGLNASGVTLVFTSIPGNVNENLKLEKLGAYHGADGDKKAGYSFITTNRPDSVAYTLKNSGNVTEAPVGGITLTDLFGRKTTISNVNPNGSLALIGQTRTYVSCIKLKTDKVQLDGQSTDATGCDNSGLWPGRYSVKLDVFYGQNGNNTQEIVGTASFWYLPWWFLLVVLVILLVIAFYVWRGYSWYQRKYRGGKSTKVKPNVRRR